VIAHLEKAVALNQGDFLEDLTLGDWYLARRAQIHQQYLEALLTLGRLLQPNRRREAHLSCRRSRSTA